MTTLPRSLSPGHVSQGRVAEMIHLYAFTDAGAPLPAVAGIGGGGIAAVPVEDVAAVFGRLETTGLDREDVVAHGLVVEALREVVDAVLPARFGERFAGEGALADAVAPRLATLRAGLARVRGCVEFGVRMVADPETTPDNPAHDGRSYMRERLAELEHASAVAAELHRPLTRCARASVVSPGGDHSAAYLVSSDEQKAFERALAGFISAHPSATVLCTGPWAPYNFAEVT
jgi:hypothetical protein